VYLKSLTLKGFKSFASSTTLQLEPGITCIVGPNGSGKSNVVDALAWVMGEQGAKSLRGGKMEDVIFAGTSGRPPLGRAEVQLTIDNSDGALPIEYAEVTISRTMFRNGGSSTPSTARPAGCSTSRSCSATPASAARCTSSSARASSTDPARDPEERRGFIEEAAGVLKHRKRKEKALRKLDATEGNLTRLQDLLVEIRRQLKPLGRQAEVARRPRRPGRRARRPARLLADDLVTARTALEQELADETMLVERRAEVEAAIAEAREAEAALEAGAARGPAGAGAGPGDLVRPVRAARAAPRHPVLAAERVRNAAGEAEVAGGARPRAARGRGRAGPRAGAGDRAEVEQPPGGPRDAVAARKTAEDAARRGGAPHRRPAARRRRPPRGAGPAARPGQRAEVPRRRRRRRDRPAHPRPRGRRRPRRARAARLHRAGDQGRRPRRRRGGARRRARGADGRPLDDLEERLAKAREEASRGRARALRPGRPQGGPRARPQPQGRRRRPARRLRPVSGLLGSVAALLTVAPATRPPSPRPRLGRRRGRRETPTPRSARSATSRTDDLGRAGLLLGGGPTVRRRPRLARLPAGRDVRRRRGRVPRRAAAARPAALQGRGRRRPRRRPRAGRRAARRHRGDPRRRPARRALRRRRLVVASRA
jgi:chromosome segregation protein